jgi:hypothetical protein
LILTETKNQQNGEEKMRWHSRGENWVQPVKWVGTATGVVGALLIALNIGAVGVGFVFFAISSALWALAGWVHRENSLIVLLVVFLVIDLVGIWNWLLA